MNTTHKTKLGIEILERRQMLTVLTFSDAKTIGSVDGSVRTAKFIDFARDTGIDILSVSSGSTNIHVSNGENRFADPNQLLPSGGLIGAFDIDGDTSKDLVFGQMSALDGEGAHFRWYKNDPVTQQLDKVVDWKGLSGAANVIDAADIDGDGDLDLAGGFAYTHHDTYQTLASLQWYENVDGSGDFELRVIEENPDGFGGGFVKLVDLDSDGDADLVTNHAWYENVEANFIKHALDGSRRLLDVGDVDGDGDIDLLTEARRSQVGWREHLDGAGTFAAQRTIDGAIGVREGGIQLSDMDLDGDLDLLALNADEDTLNWYENYSGEGDFGRRQIIDDVRNIFFVDSMDIDGDNDIDILTGRRRHRGTRLILLEGQGAVTPGDSNRDGVFDSSDLVHVFQAGEYEDHLNDNSTFEEGDWNGDSEFNSSDFVFVFQQGNYVAEAQRVPTAQSLAARLAAKGREANENDPWEDDDDWWIATFV